MPIDLGWLNRYRGTELALEIRIWLPDGRAVLLYHGDLTAQDYGPAMEDMFEETRDRMARTFRVYGALPRPQD